MTMLYLRTWKKDWSYRRKVRIFDHREHRRMLAMEAIPKVCFRDLVILVIWHQRRSSFAPYLFCSGRLAGGGANTPTPHKVMPIYFSLLLLFFFFPRFRRLLKILPYLYIKFSLVYQLYFLKFSLIWWIIPFSSYVIWFTLSINSFLW